MRLLEGKRAIVTGGSHPGGIGQATARLFVEHGARVVTLDRDPSMQSAAELALVADIAKPIDCDKAVTEAALHMGGLDILVNNAGIVASKAISEMSSAEFTQMLDVNLVGTFNMTRSAIPYLKTNKHASIINLGSIAAQRGGGLLGGSHYAASKGGVASFTKATARELAPFGVRANAVAPGIIDTGMTLNKYSEERRVAICETIPLGRFGTAVDVANVILFLASSLSGYITGATLDVNGGYHIH